MYFWINGWHLHLPLLSPNHLWNDRNIQLKQTHRSNDQRKRRNVSREEILREFLEHKRQTIQNWDTCDRYNTSKGRDFWKTDCNRGGIFVKKIIFYFRIKIKSHTEFAWFGMCCFFKKWIRDHFVWVIITWSHKIFWLLVLFKLCLCK